MAQGSWLLAHGSCLMTKGGRRGGGPGPGPWALSHEPWTINRLMINRLISRIMLSTTPSNSIQYCPVPSNKNTQMSIHWIRKNCKRCRSMFSRILIPYLRLSRIDQRSRAFFEARLFEFDYSVHSQANVPIRVTLSVVWTCGLWLNE